MNVKNVSGRGEFNQKENILQTWNLKVKWERTFKKYDIQCSGPCTVIDATTSLVKLKIVREE